MGMEVLSCRRCKEGIGCLCRNKENNGHRRRAGSCTKKRWPSITIETASRIVYNAVKGQIKDAPWRLRTLVQEIGKERRELRGSNLKPYSAYCGKERRLDPADG